MPEPSLKPEIFSSSAYKTKTRDPDPHRKFWHAQRNCWQPEVLAQAGTAGRRKCWRKPGLSTQRDRKPLKPELTMLGGTKYDGHTLMFSQVTRFHSTNTKQ
jgi:hypothetical protein